MELALSHKQRAMIAYDNAERPLITIAEGAVRSGKTWANFFLWMAHVGEMADQKRDFILTGYTIGSIERNFLKPFSDFYGITITLDKHSRFHLAGNMIHCFGADSTDSYKPMTGMTAYGWYANELVLQHPNTVQEAFNRCSGKGYRIFWDTNPSYPEHPIKTDYIDRSGEQLKSGAERIKAWHFEIDDNPFLEDHYVENLKASTPPGMWYDRAIKGLWVAAEGLVWDNYDSSIHVVDPFPVPDSWQRVRAIDWGYTNPFVCLWGALDPDGRLHIYREYAQTNTLIGDHARHIKEADKAEVLWTVADHDAQDNAELMQHGIQTRNAQKDILAGIRAVADRLVVCKDGRPRATISRECEGLRREIGQYVWTERQEGKPVKEEPVKIHDHRVDAFRYMVMELDAQTVPDVQTDYFGHGQKADRFSEF